MLGSYKPSGGGSLIVLNMLEGLLQGSESP